ncbi:BatD family protein [bacterium]|nr:BatD family protein [bacterium]
MFSCIAFAEPPLLSLEVESTTLQWQDEFVVKLSIYAPAEMDLPPVTVDGLDQFQLQGTGKNLLQIPRGKTKRWILTYTLIASETGNFKIGPAILSHQGQTYRSNIVFLNIEGPVPSKPVPPPAPPKVEKKSPAAPSKQVAPPKQETKPKQEKKPPVKEPELEPKPEKKEVVKPPVVMSAAQIGDRILVLMESRKNLAYQFQGIPVTVRLLSQLPVENLQFLEEADFPGFLRYDFPFTSKPKGEVVNYRNQKYASYELVKFLLFPLQEGKIEMPPVRCELKVRVPSGSFPEADLRLNLERSSNILNLQVKASPEGAAVGDFSLRNEIVSDEPDYKIIRMILEGKGQLSTFNFPEIAGPRFFTRRLGVSTNAKIEGENLISKKTQDVEITPEKSTTSVALPEVNIKEFDPDSGHLSALRLPSMNFQFRPPGAASKQKLDFPKLKGSSVWLLFLILGFLTLAAYFRNYRPPRSRGHLRLHHLFSGKNPKLQISKTAARNLYQQIAMQIAQQDGDSSSLMEALRRHLPQEEWLNVTRGLRKLERTAYSQTKPVPVTYEEMKKICEKIEALWLR